jgi:TRAP-type transport system small permease protein
LNIEGGNTLSLLKRIIGLLVIIIFSLLIIVVTLQVISRMFSLSMPWTEEAAKFLFIWVALIGGYFTIHKGSNITFDLLLEYIPKKIWPVVFSFINLVSILFLAIVGYLGFTLSILNMNNLSPVMAIPYGYIYLALPIGALVMILAQIETFLSGIKPKEERTC